ncbi:Uncharacterised protein [Vibrio cholerae]|nr:Uncharacterised protein [Vibrio cholerae]
MRQECCNAFWRCFHTCFACFPLCWAHFTVSLVEVQCINHT